MTTDMQNSSRIPNVLTIAGSDSGGGAGIQADIKAISANGAFACSVITALTAQNTVGVTAIHDVPVEIIAAQIDAVLSDIDIAVVKIGMLSQPEVIHVICEKIKQYELKNIVLDPVMVATSGDLLMQEEAVGALKQDLIPLVQIVTPNLQEAAILLGSKIAKNKDEMLATGMALADQFDTAVLLKGGHLEGGHSGDLLVQIDGSDETIQWFTSERIDTKNTHGTGCTLSSALAVQIAKGYPLNEAVGLAKSYIHKAISEADVLNVGHGSGPVHHFGEFY